MSYHFMEPQPLSKNFSAFYNAQAEATKRSIQKSLVTRKDLPADMAWILFEDTCDIRFLLNMEEVVS